MKKIYRWSSLLLLTLVALTGCNNNSELLESNSEPTSVEFTLGGSAGNLGVATRAEQVKHTDEEKAVKNLWAVAFNDIEVAAEPDNNSESNDDTFFKAIPIVLAPESTLFSFSLGKEGDFQICFIANAGQDITEYLTGNSGPQTVNELKTFITTKDCDDKKGGMLMVSPFHHVKSSWTVPFELGIVNLTRAMARIDVHNLAQGITITQIDFLNRATKSRLYSTGATNLEEGITTENKTYIVNLDGNTAGNACTAEIYSYEQLANIAQEQGSKIPALKISYHTDSEPDVTKHQTVRFVHSDESDSEISIGLKRNYLYQVKFTRSASEINAKLEVLDWNQGEEISVGPDEIGGGESTDLDNGNGIAFNPDKGIEIDVF